MCEAIKSQAKHIKLLPIVLNGETRGEQASTIATIKVFEEIFGKHFWPHACVVVTHFSNSPE
jgi:hypothetical protein